MILSEQNMRDYDKQLREGTSDRDVLKQELFQLISGQMKLYDRILKEVGEIASTKYKDVENYEKLYGNALTQTIAEKNKRYLNAYDKNIKRVLITLGLPF